jgi:predicted transcriptional regulator
MSKKIKEAHFSMRQENKTEKVKGRDGPAPAPFS